MLTLYLFTVRSVNDSLYGIFFIRAMPNLNIFNLNDLLRGLVSSLPLVEQCIMVILILGFALPLLFDIINCSLILLQLFCLYMCVATKRKFLSFYLFILNYSGECLICLCNFTNDF
ncbi:hypothetical protein ACB092_07G114800 [Castanea dentata]